MRPGAPTVVAPAAVKVTPCGRMATTTEAPSAWPLQAKSAMRVTDAARRDGAADLVQRAEEARHEEAFRPVVKLLRPALLDDPAAAHQHDAVAHPHRLFRIVGDDDGRGAGLAQDRKRIGADAVPEPAIETGERLVHQEHAGSRHDGAGKRDALLLAARNLVRIGFRKMREADARQRRARPPPSRARRSSAVRPNITFLSTVRCGKSA